MTQASQTFRKVVLAALIASISSVYVQADLVSASRDGGSPAIPAAKPQVQLSGCLITTGNHPVNVNGTSAKTGDTIFSGQRIQSPAAVGATIEIAGLGRVDVAQDSEVILNFEAGRLSVTLIRGCAVVYTLKGVTGTLASAGESANTDPLKNGEIRLCTGDASALSRSREPGATGEKPDEQILNEMVNIAAHCERKTKGGLFGLGTGGTALLLGAIGAGTTVAIVATSDNCVRPPDASPSAPPGPNQCL